MPKTRLALLICSLLLIIAPIHAQDNSAPFVVAWLLNGELWVSDGTTTEQPIALNTLLHASLSPDRTMLAYVTAGEYPPPELMVIAIADTTLVQHLSSTVFRAPEGAYIEFSAPVWVGNEAVVFNTIEVFEGIAGAHNRYDVQRLDIIDGTLTELLPTDEGGDMVPSPDDRWLAIRQAGSYGPPNQAGFIQIIEASTGQPVTERFSFPAVATASEIVWLPSVHWSSTSDTVMFAIPHPDAVYMLDTAPPAQVCRLTVAAALTCAEAAITYPAQVVVNDDLSRIAYINQGQLVWGAVHGEPQSIELNGAPVVWLDRETLVYQRYVGEAGLYRTDTQARWEPSGQPVINFQGLEDGRWLLATGDYAALTIGIFEPTSATFEFITTLGGGYPIFVER